VETLKKSTDRKLYTVQFGPTGAKAEVPAGVTILDAARKAGVFIESLCAGDGVCGKCRVIVRRGLVDGGTTNHLTREEIREGHILACEARVAGDLIIEVPPESRLSDRVREVDIAEQRLSEGATLERQPTELDPLVKRLTFDVPLPTLDNNRADFERLEHALRELSGATEFQMGLKVSRTLPEAVRRNQGTVTATFASRGTLTEIMDVVSGEAGNPFLALAVDAGTTSVVAHLVDLMTGQTLGAAAKYNSQAVYGGDVIRRIIWCSEEADGLQQMHNTIVEDINILIEELLEKLRLSKHYISLVVAAANTAIMHTLIGLNPEWIRREPYVGVVYQPPPLRAAEIGLTINPRGLLYCLPSVSSFVGADITAGVLAVGMHEMDEPRMLIDIGTNGEIVIGNKDWMVCASASAGPAFEGAGTRDGMRAMRGAIDHVRGWNSGHTFSFSTVGDAPPNGLCGTAYVDLLAQFMRLNMMDKTGRLHEDNGSRRLRKGADDAPEFVLVRAGEKGAARELVVTQHDVLNLLRAKGAVYAASKVLLNSLGLTLSDLKEILVAGAFGNYLDLENAVLIGLLPDIPGERLRFVGNTSVQGAKMAALNRQHYEEVRQIADGMTNFELSTDPTFMEEFTSACFFPHTNIEEFPSVTKLLSRS